MSHTLDLDMLGNPLGKRIGGGYTTCRVGDGGRAHIAAPNGAPICMQRRPVTHLRPSNARVVDCYRCIKQIAFQSNAPLLERALTTRGGTSKKHRMVPGGRQGPLVGARTPKKHAQPAYVTSMQGVQPFPRGSAKHPTQTRTRGAVGAAGRSRTHGFRSSEEGIALPHGYSPVAGMSAAEAAAYMGEVHRGLKRGKSGKGRRVPAIVPAFFALPDGTVVPYDSSLEMRANPGLKWRKGPFGLQAKQGGYVYAIEENGRSGGAVRYACMIVYGGFHNTGKIERAGSLAEAKQIAQEHADRQAMPRRANR